MTKTIAHIEQYKTPSHLAVIMTLSSSVDKDFVGVAASFALDFLPTQQVVPTNLGPAGSFQNGSGPCAQGLLDLR